MVGTMPAQCKVTKAFIESERSPLRKIMKDIEIVGIAHAMDPQGVSLRNVHAACPLARRWSLLWNPGQNGIDWYFAPLLTHLSIRTTVAIIDCTHFNSLCTAIVDARLQSLRSFELEGPFCAVIDSADRELPRDLLSFLQSTSQLTSLQLDCGLSSRLLDDFTQSPGSFLQLRTLRVHGTTIDSIASQALGRLPSLTSLKVNAITDFSFLAHVPTLQVLNVDLHAVGDRGRGFSFAEAQSLVRSFQATMSVLPRISKLAFNLPNDVEDIDYTQPITRDVVLQNSFRVAILLDAIQRLQSLTSLDLTWPLHPGHVLLLFQMVPSHLRTLKLRFDRRCRRCFELPPCYCEWEDPFSENTFDYDYSESDEVAAEVASSDVEDSSDEAAASASSNTEDSSDDEHKSIHDSKALIRDPVLVEQDAQEDELLHKELIHTHATFGLPPPLPTGIRPRDTLILTPVTVSPTVPLRQLSELRTLRLEHPTMGSPLLAQLLHATPNAQRLELELPALGSLKAFHEARTALTLVTHLALGVGYFENSVSLELRHLFHLHSLKHFRFSSQQAAAWNWPSGESSSNLPSSTLRFPEPDAPEDVQRAFGVHPQSDTFCQLKSVSFARWPLKLFDDPLMKGDWAMLALEDATSET